MAVRCILHKRVMDETARTIPWPVQMVHMAAPSATEQYDYANARHIPVLVTLHGASFSASDTVKVQAGHRKPVDCLT